MTAAGSSLPEVQALLRTLAAGRRAAELGTAFGEGARAIASNAESLVTAELDPGRTAHARTALADLRNVTLLEGDWRAVLPPHAPSTSSSWTAAARRRRPTRPCSTSAGAGRSSCSTT